MKSILDPSFKYINAASTDIRETFKRVRREQAKGQSVPATVVVPIRKQEKK